MKEFPTFFPSQKIPSSKKNEDWYKRCLNSAEALALYRYAGLGETHRKMQIWDNLYNDIIDEEEIERVFNPMQISEAAFPASIKNYPLSVPKIDLLRGEEIKRKFDWSVLAQNEETISEMDNQIKEEIVTLMLDDIVSGNYDEEKLESKIKDISKYYSYSYKNLNEIAATRVLQYLWRQQVLQEKFNSGFTDALIKGWEIYRIDDVGGEPTVSVCNPRHVFPIRRGSSYKIEDADIIVEVAYEPIGKIIDEFYDYLSSDEVSELETGQLSKGDTSGVLGYQNRPPRLFTSTQMGGESETVEELFALHTAYNLPYDSEGNVRVIRARWRGRKKIGKLTYFDPETGDKQEKLVSEKYKVNTDLGEYVKWIWVNEAYEATKIADRMYVKMQPREFQVRFFDNPSKCFLGYVGTDYGKSLMSRMEPYQYLYNVYMRRLELAIAKYKGPIYELDISKKPDEWELDQWMYYAEILGWAVVDPFNEGKKGMSLGKLSGNFNTTGKVLDADVGNYIQQLIMMLRYIERQMGQIAGVTEQREGQIDNRETLGGIERSVTQSSHITEKWFFIHDETKKRVMAALLDVAKAVWKNKSKKLGFIMEDMSRAMVNISEDFSSTEYDIFVSNATTDTEIREVIKQLSHAAVQGGASLTLPINILRSDSITEMAKKIEQEEAKRNEQTQAMKQMELESNERIEAARLEDKKEERELAYFKISEDNNTKLLIAGITSQNNEEDNSKIEEDRLKLENKKHEDGIDLKKRQLSETERHNKVMEKKSNSKANR